MSGSTPPERQGCHRCGKSDHDGRTCKFRQAKCHSCGKIGHIAPVCRSGQSKRPRNRRGRQNSKKTNLVTAEGQATAELDSELAMHACTMSHPPNEPIRVDLEVSGQKLTMDVDTGAAVPILSEAEYWRKFPKVKLI